MVKVAEKYSLYLYRVYNKRVYKEHAERVRNVRERVFLFSVYRYSIIEKRKGRDKEVYVYLRPNICSLYIDI